MTLDADNPTLDREQILRWLREDDPHRLEELWARADAVRAEAVGPEVHLRGLIEISSYCLRSCGYCGLRVDRRDLPRYRMSDEEILACAQLAVELGYGTVVMQAGEDYALTAERIAHLVRQIKSTTPLAVTLSLGERSTEELNAWREAGADRYLLRFETSDPDLYRRIHPPRPGHAPADRIAILRELKHLGYEAGSGIMVGIPGQTYDSVADDILRFRELDLDMIGIGPYLPHSQTPLGRGEWSAPAPAGEQVPADELMVYKAVALTRLACPQANLPSTTALATINRETGRELGLQRGANVVMPNLTPVKYRAMYEIYPAKSCIAETAEACHGCLKNRILSLGREIGTGPGRRRKATGDHQKGTKETKKYNLGFTSTPEQSPARARLPVLPWRSWRLGGKPNRQTGGNP